MSLAPGLEREQALKNAGFGDDEVAQWKTTTTSALQTGGFAQADVDEYFGVQKPDTAAMKSHVETNISAAAAENKESGSTAKPAEGILGAIEAGWQTSVTGLFTGGLPTTVLPEDASRAMHIASSISTLAGDLPAMAAGMVSGGALGSEVPIVGNVIGAAAGSFAVPSAMRKILMDHYEKGDVLTAGDFADRVVSTAWEATKGAATGAATAFVGGKVGAKVIAEGAAPVIGEATRLMSEIGTMTAVSKGLEGQLPNSNDFINGAIVVGGLHAITAAPALRNMYAKTGELPSAVAERTNSDVTLKQEVAASNSKYLPEPEPPPPLAKPEIERTAAETKVLERVGKTETTSTGILSDLKGLTVDDAYTALLDDLNPIKLAGEILTETKGGGQDPYIAARLYKGWSGKLERAIKFNTIDYNTGKANGEGFVKILKDIPDKDRDGFTAYALSKRAVEKAGQGIKTGIDFEAANEVVAAGGKFKETFDRLVDYQSRMVDYAKDSGLLSTKDVEAMRRANKDFVPFYRIQEADPLVGDIKAGGKLFKRMKGSDAQIVDPLESVVKNTEAIFRAAERNRVLKSVVELQEINRPEGIAGEDYGLIKRVKADQRPINIEREEVGKFLSKQGFDEADIPPEGFTIFRPQPKSLGENEFQIYRDGKREVYETTPELSQAMKALDNHSGMVGLWGSILKAPASLLRAGVTLSPDFTLRNFVRDQFTATTQSKFGQLPIADAVISLKSIIKKDEVFQNYLSSGASSGMFGEMERMASIDLNHLNRETGFLNNTWNTIRHPLDAMKVVSEAVENIPRLSEFRRGGQTTEAAFAAREVTVDFARAGARVRAVNAIVPFMNVGFQGTERAIRSFQENPKMFSAKAAASLTLPSMLLWWANKDDSRYNDAPDYQKNLFWIIPTDKWEKAANYADAAARPEDLRRQNPDGSWEVNNGNVYRIPKPFEVGILFSSMPERILDGIYKQDASALTNFGETIQQALVPNILPTAVVPILEQATNRSFFTGAPVVNHMVEKVMPEYQYTEYTSETAKQIGKIIGHIPFVGKSIGGVGPLGPEDAQLSSPMVVDNYIRAWTGTVGQYATQLVDAGLKAAGVGNQAPKPASTLADMPIIKAFVVRYPSAKPQAVVDFDNTFQETSHYVNSVQMLMKRGDLNAANKLMQADPGMFIKLDGIHQAMQQQSSFIQKVNQDPAMSPNDKRQIIDSVYYQLTTLAKSGNTMIKEYRKSLGETASKDGD